MVLALLLLGWLVFLFLLYLRGGPTVRDDHVTLYSSWMMAHGSASCMYRVPSPAVDYPVSAPLFTLLETGLQWVTRVGFSHPYPSGLVALDGCRHDYAALNSWLSGTAIARRTLWLGTVVWPLLGASGVWLVRVRRGAASSLEWIVVGVFSLWPVYSLPFLEYYHPQDVLALAALLGALAALESRRFELAGVLGALAFLSQQNVALALLVLLLMVPTPRACWRFLAGAFVTTMSVVIPLAIISGTGAVHAVVTGTGLNDNPVYSTWMGILGIYGGHALLISRAGPLVLGVLGLWWWWDRHGAPTPAVVLDLVACTFALRLVLEENLWSYYSVGLVTCWILGDFFHHRRRPGPWVWSLIVSVLPWTATTPVIDSLHLATLPVWVWQLLLLPAALVLSARPLWTRTRRGGYDPDPVGLVGGRG
jgi:hypothetical protein